MCSCVAPSHYCRFKSKAGTIFTSRDSILQVFAIWAKTAKEGKKKFARMEQTLNKHEDIKRERERV